jgi:transposase-like protein
MQELEQARCPNKECPEFGKGNHGNIRVRGRYGKNKDKLLLYCRVCGKRFAATHGTPLFASHLPQEKVHSIIHLVSTGESLRSTARLLCLPKATVKLTVDKLESFCLAGLKGIMQTLGLDLLQMGKLWTFLMRLKDLRHEERHEDPPKAKEGDS